MAQQASEHVEAGQERAAGGTNAVPVPVPVRRVTVGPAHAAGPDMVAAWPTRWTAAAARIDDGNVRPAPVPVPHLRRAQANAAGPDIVAGLGVPRHIGPQPQTGVPVVMQSDNTAWLTTVRRCRDDCCPLCSHRRRQLAQGTLVMGLNDRWPQCAICTGRMPPTAMVDCRACRQHMCIMCALLHIAAGRYRSMEAAMQEATCVFCRRRIRRVAILRYNKAYMAHRTQIADFVRALWLPGPGQPFAH